MPPTGFQILHAVANGIHQRYTFNASARTLAQTLFIDGDNEGRFVVLAHQPRCDNAHHSRMPVSGAKHDGGPLHPLRIVFEHRIGLLENAQLLSLTLPIVSIEAISQRLCLAATLGYQNGKSIFRLIHATRRIEPRSDAKAHIHGGGPAIHSGDLLQGPKPGIEGARQALEAMAHQQPVLFHHGHDVGNGGHRDQIEQLLEIEIHRSAFE